MGSFSPMSFNGSTTSHFGSDLKNMETCCKAISEKTVWKLISQTHQKSAISLKYHSSCLFCFCFGLFRATPTAYGGSQARGRIRAVAAGLHHSLSNARSQLHLRPTSQFTAVLDPEPTERGQGSNPQPHGS